jgi:hypothetical protein
MIFHERDYASASARIAILKGRCDRLRKRVADPRAAEAANKEVAKLEKRIDELVYQQQHYSDVLSKQVPPAATLVLIDIPTNLIERRLRLGWSQADLGLAAGQERQAITRYETTRYASASLKRLIHIDHVLRKEEIRRRFRDSDTE